MGGNAFTTARRLTSAELSLLQSHCARSLAAAGLFGGDEDGVGTFVYFGDKVTHGDLDLVVPWDELEGSGEGGGVKWLKGKERGVIVDGKEVRSVSLGGMARVGSSRVGSLASLGEGGWAS
jgi:hypothetical protein